jgi:branched-subunit amino acid ABC-type transport system permease component
MHFTLRLWLALTSSSPLVISTVFVGSLGIVLERLAFRPLQGIHRPLHDSLHRVDVSATEMSCWPLRVVFQSIKSNHTGVVTTWLCRLSPDRLIIILVAWVLVAALFKFVNMSKTGNAMRAISEDRVAARWQGNQHQPRISATAMSHGLRSWRHRCAVVGPIFTVSFLLRRWPLFCLMKGIGVG